MNERGPHSQTLTGRHWYPFDPQPEDVYFADFQSLARINRFGGHTICDNYSDAEHMVRVAKRVMDLGGSRLEALGGHGHDAHEYVSPGDQIGPFLRAWNDPAACAIVGLTPDAFKGIAEIVQRAKFAVRCALDIVDVFAMRSSADLIRRADMELLATERRDLMASGPVDWGRLPEPLRGRIVPWSPAKAWDEWRDMFNFLGGKALR